MPAIAALMHSIARQKPYNNGHTVIGTLAVDWWAVTFGTERRGLKGVAVPPSPLLAVPNVTAHPSTANFILIDVVL